MSEHCLKDLGIRLLASSITGQMCKQNEMMYQSVIHERQKGEIAR